MTLELYTHPMSRGRIAHWMLEEVGAPYTLRWLSWGPEGHRNPDFLAVNPMGKVPALVHDGAVITEAAAIVMYLADAFPEADLGPRPDEKADYYRWILFAAGPLEQAQTAASLGWEIPAERRGMVGFRSIKTIAAALEQHLAGRTWSCGERFNAADVYVGSSIAWALMSGALPKTPALEAYAARLFARPAQQRMLQACSTQNNNK